MLIDHHLGKINDECQEWNNSSDDLDDLSIWGRGAGRSTAPIQVGSPSSPAAAFTWYQVHASTCNLVDLGGRLGLIASSFAAWVLIEFEVEETAVLWAD